MSNGKKLHPHLLRHSRLQNLADKGLTENMMRDYAGWTPGSNMPAIYLHSNPNGMAKRLRELDGDIPPEEVKPEIHKMLPIICPRCGEKNSQTSEYCNKCWIPLKTEVQLDELATIEYLRSPMGHQAKESVKVSKELGIVISFDLDEKVKDFQISKNNTRKRLQDWKGKESEKETAILVAKKFFGDKLVNSWLEG